MSSIELAKRVRINCLRMVHAGGSSHIGSALSCVDILAVLYGKIMSYKAENPDWEDRDRFILSKGHAGVAVYAVLAEVGFFSKSELINHYRDGSIFSGHVSHKGIPGVEFSTGSLGHGLPVSVGMALASKLDRRSNKVFVLLGDGELMEGANWEAALLSAHHKLDNLVLIIDRNNLQSIDTTENTVALESIRNKFEAFNWAVMEADGHCHDSLAKIFTTCSTGRPLVVIAHTIKGKGVSFMENNVAWHYKSPNDEQLKQALKELDR